jgi:cyclase
MNRRRIIPVLLFKDSGLYKGINFKGYKYIGDPINTIKIFNDKEVDELIFLDIKASISNNEPNYSMLSDIASECFMPLTYGGGLNSCEMIREVLKVGVEKVVLNTYGVLNPLLVRDSSKYFGSSTMVASIDVKKDFLGKYRVFIYSGNEKTRLHPVEWAKKLEVLGIGEILINSIDKDGTLSGYDWDLVAQVSSAVKVPVIASGGASNIHDFYRVFVDCKASAAAAGAQFVFQGKHKAVLISYPSQDELLKLFE